MARTSDRAPKPVYPIHQKLTIVWSAWLVFRLVGIALASLLVQTHSTIIAGIAGMTWQALWLIPAFIATPYIIKGKSPYALLLISMLTLVYLGGSGMTAMKYGFGDQPALMMAWLIDFVLLALINSWLFVLLKRLPKMNG